MTDDTPRAFGLASPAVVLQVSFVSAASTILFLNAFEPIRRFLVAYGPRSDPGASEQAHPEALQKESSSRSSGAVEELLRHIAALQVPHGCFIHFYVVSVLSSGFWGLQLWSKGVHVRTVAEHSARTEPDTSASMSVDQVTLLWSLVAVQGVRRLYESIVHTKTSKSSMWFGHWLLGIAFYLALGVALWIEGAEHFVPKSATSPFPSKFVSAPSIKTMLFIPVFLLASGIQHDCHAYLASLKAYTVPTHPAFEIVLCPHYLTECLIYLSFAVLSAPRGRWVNRTMLCAMIFVWTNLAVTAAGTRAWYEGRFGIEAVRKRRILIPYVW